MLSMLEFLRCKQQPLRACKNSVAVDSITQITITMADPFRYTRN